MTTTTAFPTPGIELPFPPAPEMTPEALEWHRFERDRAQALTVVAVIALPIAAFGIIDFMVAKSDLRLAILWSVRGATLLALGALWHSLREAPTRPRFERTLFTAQLIGVALAIASHVGRGADTLFITRFELVSVVVYYLMIPGRTRLLAVPAMTLSAASIGMVLFWHTNVSGPDLVSHLVCFALANGLGLLVGQHRQATAAAEEDAWRALVRARDRLQQTVAELRALRGVVPICPQCHKVRDAHNAWQQLEAYVAARGDLGFSSILCPSCLVGEFGAVLEDKAVAGRPAPLMTVPRHTPAGGTQLTTALTDPSPSPDALEHRRFERDLEQARQVLAALALPLAAFGVTDALVAGSDLRLLAAMWSVRALVLVALALVWYLLGRSTTRVAFERLLFATQLAGVVISIGTHFGRGPDMLVVTRFELLCVVGYYVAMPMRTLFQVVPALTLTSVSLGLVAFWHEGVTGPELVSHVVCFALANVLGVLLTTRRKAVEAEEERAWRDLVRARNHLQQTVVELRALRGVVPICPQCRKVRGARNAWQQLEAYVASRGDVEFSPILCPPCLVGEFGAVLEGKAVAG